MLDVIIFAEADADARLARELGDRVLCEKGPEWLDEAVLPSVRHWRGLEPELAFVKWADLKHHANKHLPRYIGHAKNGPRGSDYAMAHKALMLVALLPQAEGLPAVLLLRDHDNCPDGRTGGAEERRRPAQVQFAKGCCWRR